MCGLKRARSFPMKSGASQFYDIKSKIKQFEKIKFNDPNTGYSRGSSLSIVSKGSVIKERINMLSSTYLEPKNTTKQSKIEDYNASINVNHLKSIFESSL